MNIPWTIRRQLFFLFIFLVIIGVILFSLWYYVKKPTCFDNKQNQDEEGVDCDGQCEKECLKKPDEIVVLWSKSFKVRDDYYEAAALIENPNFSLGTDYIKYTFKLFDENNILIAVRDGSTFINPGEKYLVLEPIIKINGGIPKRTFIEFDTNNSKWKNISKKPLKLIVKGKQFYLGNPLRFSANIKNESLSDAEDVYVAVLLSDEQDNIKAVGTTKIDIIKNSESADAFFTWPDGYDFKGESLESLVLYRTNLSK